MRSRTAGVMTTLMRNGRDRRSGKPVKCHARQERVLLFGTRSADYIRASGHNGCINRPNTWLHPNASLKCPIFPLHRGRRPYMALKRTNRPPLSLSASLIGRLGSSTFRLSTAAMLMSLTGSRFSSESAPRPFHHGIRGRGGTIFRRPYRLTNGRSKRTNELTSSIVPRGTSFHCRVELECPPIESDPARLSCRCRGLFPGPAELSSVNPDAVGMPPISQPDVNDLYRHGVCVAAHRLRAGNENNAVCLYLGVS